MSKYRIIKYLAHAYKHLTFIISHFPERRIASNNAVLVSFCRYLKIILSRRENFLRLDVEIIRIEVTKEYMFRVSRLLRRRFNTCRCQVASTVAARHKPREM